MNFNILSIGKFKSDDNYEKLFLDYKKRIPWKINLKELVLKKNLENDELKKAEGELLISNISKNSKIIVLDERGLIISTNDFYKKITDYENQAFPNIDFIIGGSSGLSEEVRKKADFILSFGKMVFPHMMIRTMLIEQLYRVYTLKNNIPYHK